MTTITLVYGLPGSGKTAACSNLVNRLDLLYLAVDDIWTELFPSPSYSIDESDAVFSELLRRLTEVLSRNPPPRVLLEGVFASPARIQQVGEVCSQLGHSFRRILIECEHGTALTRACRREQNPMSPESWHFLAQRFSSASLADLTLSTENITPSVVAAALTQYLQCFQ